MNRVRFLLQSLGRLELNRRVNYGNFLDRKWCYCAVRHLSLSVLHSSQNTSTFLFERILSTVLQDKSDNTSVFIV